MARRGENIRKRKDGRWEARIIEGYQDGRSKYRSIYGRTYTEVKAKREEAIAKIALEPMPAAKKLATFDFIAADWLHAIRSMVKESTYTRYHRTVHEYLLPKFGNIQLVKLTAGEINRMSAELLQSGGKRGTGLSPKTVSDMLSVLKLILCHGTRSGYACPDTAQIERPRTKLPRIKTLCSAEMQRLERILWRSDDNVSLGILLSLYTGVRIGELCGLRWEDVDFNRGTVKISRTIERIANLNVTSSAKTKVIISAPKTENGIREIPLPQAMLAYLCMKKKSGQCYIVTGSERCSEPHTMYVRYQRYLKRNGFDAYTFHALRHTFATRCVEAGFDVKSLSEILGHSDVTTTLRSYVHPSMEKKRQQIEMLLPENIRGQDNGCIAEIYNNEKSVG